MSDESDVLVIDMDGCQYRAKVIVPGKMALSGLVFTRPMAEQISKVLAHFARTGALPVIKQEEQAQ